MIYSDPLFKENKIIFELNQEETNKDELIQYLVSSYKNFEIKLKKLEKENESLKKQISEIKMMLEKKNEEEPLKKLMDFPSKILNNKNELDLLIYPISSKEDKKIKIFKKLYCASIDGDTALNFHSKCDNKFNTLVLIETPDKRKFGGFSHENWKTGNNYEPNVFLFSLDLLKIYPLKKGGYSIKFYSYTGLVFGGNEEIYIRDKCISTKSCSVKNKSDNFDFLGIENPLCNFKDDENISLIDYEVYQIIFE